MTSEAQRSEASASTDLLAGEAMGTTPFCHVCFRPVIGAAVYGNAGEAYHPECTRPPEHARLSELTMPRYAPLPSEPGCQPLKTLSEDDVRRIVQEELAKLPANRY